MCFQYSSFGIDNDVLDYSDTKLDDLNELALVESKGIDSINGQGGTPIDLNCDTDTNDTVRKDMQCRSWNECPPDPCTGANDDILHGFNDWANLQVILKRGIPLVPLEIMGCACGPPE
jgi:hypothetical protein